MPKKFNFWGNVRQQNDCWVWIGAKDTYGYGAITFKGHQWRTHRLMWYLTYGNIPEGMCVLHHCDNPPCVNPDHLWLGTHTENMQDSSKKGRKRGWRAWGKGIGNVNLSQSSAQLPQHLPLRNLDSTIWVLVHTAESRSGFPFPKRCESVRLCLAFLSYPQIRSFPQPTTVYLFKNISE